MQYKHITVSLCQVKWADCFFYFQTLVSEKKMNISNNFHTVIPHMISFSQDRISIRLTYKLRSLQDEDQPFEYFTQILLFII